MKKMKKVGEGAYFVPSYPELTVVTFQRRFNNQTIVMGTEEGNDEEQKEAEDSVKEDEVKYGEGPKKDL